MVANMITLRESILHLATLYATATKSKARGGGVSLSSLSTKLFNDGKTLSRIEQGGDLTTASFERALTWFDANWPDDEPWPADVIRPSLAASAASTEAA